MRSFCARTDDGSGVVVDCSIVRYHPCDFEERRSIALDVCGLRPNEADEVMHRSHFVVRDLKEEGRDDLLDSCEVGVGLLSGDWIEFLERMSKFRHNFLRRHCV